MSTRKLTSGATSLSLLLLVLLALKQEAVRNNHEAYQPVREPQVGNASRLNAPSSIQTGVSEAIDTAHPAVSSVGPSAGFKTPTPTIVYPSPTRVTYPTPDATHFAQGQAGRDLSRLLRESKGALLAQGSGPAPAGGGNVVPPDNAGFPRIDQSSSYIIEEVTVSPPLQVDASLFDYVPELGGYQCPQRICAISKFWRIRLKGIGIMMAMAISHSYPVYIGENRVGVIGDSNMSGNIVLLDPSALRDGARIGVGTEVWPPNARGEIRYLQPIDFIRAPDQ
jgi:hypothetical protein